MTGLRPEKKDMICIDLLYLLCLLCPVAVGSVFPVFQTGSSVAGSRWVRSTTLQQIPDIGPQVV